MVAQVGNLQVRVGADITGLSTGMRQAQRQVASSAAAMKRSATDMQLTFKEVATFSSRLFRTGALVFGGAFGAQKLLEMADAAKTLTAQLRLATSQFGNFAKANKDVRDISERSRSDLLSTAELYSALQRNSDQFGASQAQVARVTETVAKAFKISGATADEASNATRQLVQAFQSGRLQGDEFRSVLENAPRLARLLADSLGTTIGKLREMSKEGQLTSDILVRAFSDKKFTAGLDAEFEKLPVTFDQAMGQLYNSAVLALGAFDEGGQFSTSIANFITNGVKGFADLEKAAYDFGVAVSDLFGAIEVIRQGLGSLETSGIGSFANLTDATFTWRDALSGTLGVIDGVANAFANLFNAPGNLIRLATGIGGAPITNPVNLQGKFDEKQKIADLQRFYRRQSKFSQDNVDTGPPAFHPSASGKKKKAAKGPRDRSDDVEAQFEREVQQANLDILRAKQQLAGSSEQHAALEVAIIQLEHDIEAAAIDDKVRRAKRDFAEKKITRSALEQVEAQASVLKARNDEKTAIQLRAFVEGQLARAEQANFEAADQQRTFALDALHSADSLATTQAEHRRLQLQILDSEINQRRLELQHEKDLAIRNGATAEEIKVIQDKIDHLSAERAQGASEINQNTRNPLEEWAAQIPKTKEEIIGALQEIEVKGLDGLSEALTGILTGTESLKSAFHNLAASILADLLQMTIKMLLFKAITAAFGGGATGGGSVPGFATGGSITVGGHGGTDKNLLALNGIPIARVSYGERINIANDQEPAAGMGLSVTMHNDFRGASPEAVASIKAHLDQLEATLPSRVLSTMSDARERFVWRG